MFPLGHGLFWITVLGWVSFETYLWLFRSHRKAGEMERTNKYLVLAALCMGFFGGPLLFPQSVERFLRPFSSLRLFVFAFLFGGLLIRILAVRELGSYFSLDLGVHSAQKLCARGLYAHIRHPGYLGILLICLGIALALSHWPAAMVAFTLPLCALLYRIHLEEKILVRAWGETYLQYQRVTYRLIPYLY